MVKNHISRSQSVGAVLPTYITKVPRFQNVATRNGRAARSTLSYTLDIKLITGSQDTNRSRLRHAG